MVYEVTDENFEAEVASSAIPCLIEFTAPWCAPCKNMLPRLEQLSEEYDGRVKFVVAALPYLVYVTDGMQTPLFDESVPLERLRERIDFMLGGGQAPTTRPL